MPRSRRPPTDQLRTAIDCLPLDTRLAMLEGVRSQDIIVGAYTDRRGGVCPMLAAHRCGGRTSFITFARAWDTFASAKRARRADARELSILTSHLEASILNSDDFTQELGEAIAEHHELVARRPAEREQPVAPRPARVRPADPDRVRPGDPDRSKELAHRAGWAWMRPFRRWDEYERALARLEEEAQRVEDEQRHRELEFELV